MSVSAVLESPDHDGAEYDLASAAGWRLADAWADGLPKGYEAVKRLTNDGRADDTAVLAKQLRRALDHRPPDEADVEHTLRLLLTKLDGGSPAESITVVGG